MKIVPVRLCNIEGCGRPYEARGLCRTHYGRLRVGLEVEGPMRSRNGERPKCSIADCDGIASAKGLCRSHYMRSWYGAVIDAPFRVVMTNTECLYDDCGRIPLSLGLCASHYKQKLEFGAPFRSIRPATRLEKYPMRVCTITECQNPHYSGSMCQRHYNKARTYKLSAIQLDTIYRSVNCPICGVEFLGGDIVIDHDHACCPGERTCGKCTRGALCSRCNVALGMMADSASIAAKAFMYLSGDRIAA